MRQGKVHLLLGAQYALVLGVHAWNGSGHESCRNIWKLPYFQTGGVTADLVAGAPEDEDTRVHVFTIASGHMYERLQKIMILSVIRNTKCGLPG